MAWSDGTVQCVLCGHHEKDHTLYGCFKCDCMVFIKTTARTRTIPLLPQVWRQGVPGPEKKGKP